MDEQTRRAAARSGAPRSRAATTFALAVALAAATPARADEPVLGPSYDLATDLAVTGAAGGATLVLLALKGQLAPTTCRWCEPPALDARVAHALGWSNAGAAASASNALVVALPVAVGANLLVDGQRRGDVAIGAENLLLVAEAATVAGLLDTGVKYAVGRARPYVWMSGFAPTGHDGNLSFFSGHTTFAFAVAASSSTLLLSQRAPGAEVASAAAFFGAGVVGYLRVAADDHYLTDVLAGAAAGTLIGWAVPYVLHPPKASGLALRPAPGGVALDW